MNLQCIMYHVSICTVQSFFKALVIFVSKHGINHFDHSSSFLGVSNPIMPHLGSFTSPCINDTWRDAPQPGAVSMCGFTSNDHSDGVSLGRKFEDIFQFKSSCFITIGKAVNSPKTCTLSDLSVNLGSDSQNPDVWMLQAGRIN